MKKYVIANRRAGKFHETEKRAARASLDHTFAAFEDNVGIINDNAPASDEDRRVVVFEAEEAEIAARMQSLPDDVFLEEEILHFPVTSLPLDLQALVRTAEEPASVTGSGTDLRVTVTGDGRAVEGAEVLLFLRGPGNSRNRSKAVTGKDGLANFSFFPFLTPLGVVVTPAGGFWSKVVRGSGPDIDVDCIPIHLEGPLEWWHETLGASPFDPNRGNGIRVGVIDSGVGPHPCLEHVADIGAFIDGSHDVTGGADSGRHGSHVCGIVGARPQAEGQYAGIAPGAQMFSARVFPPDSGANQGDIVNAIDAMSRLNDVHLINMSLGAARSSAIERDAIQDALERGTLCICAAANSSGPVEWPAAFPETVAVSALGLLGFGPPGVLESTIPEQADRFANEGLYLANFSCFGQEITCAAPGVGILSTVPEQFSLVAPYAPMNGTSMASPAACGALAALLAADSQYSLIGPNSTRAERARSILVESCRDIGLAAEFQGRGVPTIS